MTVIIITTIIIVETLTLALCHAAHLGDDIMGRLREENEQDMKI